jgi:hypothetical protein
MMRSLYRVFPILIVVPLFSPMPFAYAGDECKDVLLNKVMNSTEVKRDTYYNISLLSTLNEATDDEQKKKAAAGVDIEGIPSSFTYNDARRINSSLSSSFNLKYIAEEQRWSCFAGQMAVWLRWILGLITPPISPRLPA